MQSGMKNYAVPVIITLLATVTSGGALAFSSDSEAVGEYFLAGYVVEDDYSDTSRMWEVDVTVSAGGKEYKTQTDMDGYFEVGLSAVSGITINFERREYEVRHANSPYGALSPVKDSEGHTYAVDVGKIPVVTKTDSRGVKHAYRFVTDDLTTGIPVDSAYLVVMHMTVARVVVNVSYDNDAVSGAHVILRSVSGESTQTGTTDSDGVCVITSVPLGQYYLRIECDGFKTLSSITLDVKGPLEESYQMEKRPVEKIFGMTVGHMLMVIAVAVGLVAAFIGHYFYRNLQRTKIDESDLDGPDSDRPMR